MVTSEDLRPTLHRMADALEGVGYWARVPAERRMVLVSKMLRAYGDAIEDDMAIRLATPLLQVMNRQRLESS